MGGGKQNGGGNDPTCGCDLQAGWPSASALPRGGLQGGGISRFNLNVENESGKHMHFRGERVNKNNNNTNTNNNKPKTRKNNTQKTPKTVTSAPTPKGMKKIVHKGKLYFLSPEMNVFERSTTGTQGKRVGKLVRGSKGTTIKANKTLSARKTEATPPQMEMRTPATNTGMNLNENTYEEMMNENYDLEETPNNQEGGKRRRKSRKHLRRK